MRLVGKGGKIATGDIAPLRKTIGGIECSPVELAGYLGYVVSIRGNKVKIMFRRFLFKHVDEYVVECARVNSKIMILLRGLKSVIIFRYKVSDGEVRSEGFEATGIRRIFRSFIKRMLENAREYLEKEVGRAASRSTHMPGRIPVDLQNIEEIVSMISKSLMVYDSLTPVTKGRLSSFIVELARAVAPHFRVVYVSGMNDLGFFRVILKDSKIVASYIEYPTIGKSRDPKALDSIEGLFQLRVYGVLAG